MFGHQCEILSFSQGEVSSLEDLGCTFAVRMGQVMLGVR